MSTSGTTGAELAAHFRAEAQRLGLLLDPDDDALIESARATLDLIAALQKSIDTDGAVSTGPTGAITKNPATTEIRQQRLTLAKLTQVIGHRLNVAAVGNRQRGTQPGAIRGVYSGDGGARENGERSAQRKPTRKRRTKAQ